MKTIIAVLAVLAVSTPALADNSDEGEEAYKAAKQEWRSDWKDTKGAWKDAGKPDPKPTQPAKPQRSDF